MPSPEIFLAHDPHRAGLRCAVAYLSSERDVYGWFTGTRQDGSIASAYFLLEDFHANARGRYEAVEAPDLHSDWSLEEARRHELARMQEAFAAEWLSFAGDKASVREERLGKLSTAHPTWTFYSPHFERAVLNRLAGHWVLEYRPHMERTKQAQKRRHARRARP